MSHRPYKAKSLSGAQRKVRELLKRLEAYDQVLTRFHTERLILAKLAAKGPAFYNPIEAARAEALRDKLLKQQGMNPDGSRIQ